jgi:hypothetical protein
MLPRESKWGKESCFVCLSKKANLFLNETESLNLADLHRDHPNQRKIPNPSKFCPEKPEMGEENAMFNLHGWTHKGYHV